MEELRPFLPLIILGLLLLSVFLHSMTAGRKEYERNIIDQLKLNATVKFCPPHPWAYRLIDGVEKMWCPRCRMTPGETTYSPRGESRE
jgi:hypothetical protein